MRRHRRFTAVVAITATATLALTGCTKKNDTGSGSASGGTGAKTYKVAFVPKLQGVPYFEAMNSGGKKAASELGTFNGCIRARPRRTPPPRPTSCGPTSSRRSTR